VLFRSISLKDNTTKSTWVHAKETKGTISLGSLIVLISMASFDAATLKLNPALGAIFGLSKQGIFEHKFFFQVLTSNFFHFDLLHLGGNISAILLLSAYERRIGTSRYLLVFIISAVAASILDLLLIRPDTVSLGSSAGIAGLACGYFIDYGKLTKKEWTTGILFTLFIVGLFSFYDNTQIAKLGYEIDWIAHLFGAIAAGAFILLVPGKELCKKEEQKKASQTMQKRIL